MAEAKKEEDEGQSPPPRNKKKLIILIVIGVIVLAIVGGGAAFFLLKPKPVAEEGEDGDEAPSKQGKAKKKDKKAEHAPPAFHKFDKPFTVKLQTEQQEAYLQVEVQLRVLDSGTLELLKQYDPELKHRIMLILMTKKASDLGTAQGVQRLSNEIRDTVNNTLVPPSPKKRKEEPKETGDAAAADAPVQAVLFTSFIIQ